MTSITKVLYIGVTNDLVRRVKEHKQGLNHSFTKKYHVDWLVYYEHFHYINNAIAREKELKKWRRAKKIKLINTMNPTWRDLFRDFNQRF